MKITIYEKLNSVKLYLFIRISQLLQKVKREASGLGVVEVIMILLDNPFTSSTYILSY